MLGAFLFNPPNSCGGELYIYPYFPKDETDTYIIRKISEMFYSTLQISSRQAFNPT